MNVQTDLTKEHKNFLHGVFVTAMEGGIGYWSGCSTYRWMLDSPKDKNGYAPEDIDTFYAVIYPRAEDGVWGVLPQDEDDKPLIINLEVMYRGTELFKDYCYGKITDQGQAVPVDQRKPLRENHYWRQFLAAELTRGDDGDYDADVADLIVQFGLFGKAVFG